LQKKSENEPIVKVFPPDPFTPPPYVDRCELEEDWDSEEGERNL